MMAKKGFNLFELILVLVVISVLAVIIIPRIIYSVAEARFGACFSNVARINSQIELWHTLNGEWPADTIGGQTHGDVRLENLDISADAGYFPDGVPRCPVSNVSYLINMDPIYKVTRHDTGFGGFSDAHDTRPFIP